MATLTLPDFNVTPAFTNIVATVAGAGSAKTLIQNIGLCDVAIVARASGAAPTDAEGIILAPREKHDFNAAQLWIKSFGATGKVSLTNID